MSRPLTNFNLLVLEGHLRILRERGATAAVVTLDELQELLSVYRSSHGTTARVVISAEHAEGRDAQDERVAQPARLTAGVGRE